MQVAIPIRGCATSVNEQVGATDKAATGRHQELCQVTHLVRRSCTTGRHTLDHLKVAILSWAMQFIVGQRCDDDAWRYRVDGGKIYQFQDVLFRTEVALDGGALEARILQRF